MSDANYRFTKEHEWVKLDGDSGVVTIGITEFAAGELGDIVFVELPAAGTKVKFMETMGTIEAVKTVADLYAPVSGVITEINAALEDNPEIVNESPLENGWFAKIELSNKGEIDELLTRAQYDELIGKE